jgi:hypothetical protein
MTSSQKSRQWGNRETIAHQKGLEEKSAIGDYELDTRLLKVLNEITPNFVKQRIEYKDGRLKTHLDRLHEMNEEINETFR